MTEKQATRKANALKKRLGEKWQICVWENMGWHYCVESQLIHDSIYPFINSSRYLS